MLYDTHTYTHSQPHKGIDKRRRSATRDEARPRVAADFFSFSRARSTRTVYTAL